MKNQIVIENKKAHYNYYIEEKINGGLVLKGNEVKSIRCGYLSIKESWIAIENDEIYLRHAHLTAYDRSNKFDIDENRDKKILLHKSEIQELSKKIKIKGYTLVPLKVYFNESGKCKIEIGVCKGKHLYDKRQVEKERTINRQISTYN